MTGMAGTSDVERRIESILSNGVARAINRTTRAALISGAFAMIAIPLLIGLLSAPALRAQSRPADPASPVVTATDGVPQATQAVFDVASVKENKSGSLGGGFRQEPGRFTVTNLDLRWILQFACGVREYQLVNAPSGTRRYDVAATFAPPETNGAQRGGGYRDGASSED